MSCDTVVALGPATVDGQTLFGHNCDRPSQECSVLRLEAGREFAYGETLTFNGLKLPQVRHTFTVLGNQLAGCWGYSHGVNEHGVAIGHAGLRSRLSSPQPALTGPDLVRLALERSKTARQAVDLLTDLVSRHGQAPAAAAGATRDHAFLVADDREAFAVETAGEFWAYQEVQQIRAVSNLSIIRQDWDKIAHGLAGLAIERGWWPADGTKLDFAGAITTNPVGELSALRRWGRATMLLEQQSGHIDHSFLRRLLSDHYEGMHSEIDPLSGETGPASLCQHPSASHGLSTAASMIVALAPATERLRIAWSAFGPPCISVFFPIVLDGELPRPFAAAEPEAGLWGCMKRVVERLQRDRHSWTHARAQLNQLQQRFDQEAEDFAVEGAVLKQRGEQAEVRRLATLFMEENLAQFAEVLRGLHYPGPRFVPVETWSQSLSVRR